MRRLGLGFILRCLLGITLTQGGLCLVGAAEADAAGNQASKAKKKNRAAQRARARRARRANKKKKARAKKPKITARTIKRWQRKGWTDARILAQAEKAGYRATKRERVRLRKARVRPSLRVALAKRARRPTKKSLLNLSQQIDPNDIDFDSVPPPEGMPKELAEAHRRDARRRLNTSLRPSAPFDANQRARTPIRKNSRAARPVVNAKN